MKTIHVYVCMSAHTMYQYITYIHVCVCLLMCFLFKVCSTSNPLLLQFCDDMRLMFDNAWLYNRKTSRVYKYCTKLSEVFESNINVAMRSLGYCCGEKVSDYGVEREREREIINGFTVG